MTLNNDNKYGDTGVMALSRKAFGIATLSIMTLFIPTFNIMIYIYIYVERERDRWRERERQHSLF